MRAGGAVGVVAHEHTRNQSIVVAMARDGGRRVEGGRRALQPCATLALAESVVVDEGRLAVDLKGDGAAAQPVARAKCMQFARLPAAEDCITDRLLSCMRTAHGEGPTQTSSARDAKRRFDKSIHAEARPLTWEAGRAETP